MKTMLCVCIGLLFSAICVPADGQTKGNDLLFQTSTINALLMGLYDGETTFADLKQHGDFGLGTFDGLDGEMVGLDGHFFQVTVDGSVRTVSGSTETPFSTVTFFRPDRTALLEKADDYEHLRHTLDNLLPSENIFYAVRIEGPFRFIRARSVPVQQKPYPPLNEVVRHQKVFEFHDIEGTLVGFRSPDYMQGINVPGYHMHFISQDRKSGGHVLECRMEKVRVSLDDIHSLSLVLPHTGDFYQVNLGEQIKDVLHSVEKEVPLKTDHSPGHGCGCMQKCREN
jgi:acetolactate decarboxylase